MKYAAQNFAVAKPTSVANQGNPETPKKGRGSPRRIPIFSSPSPKRTSKRLIAIESEEEEPEEDEEEPEDQEEVQHNSDPEFEEVHNDSI